MQQSQTRDGIEGAIVRFICLATLVAGLTGCGDPAADLVGNWIQQGGSGPQAVRLILREDGTGKLEVPGGINYQFERWEIKGERQLTVQIFSQEVLLTFILNDDTLEISRVEDFDEMNGTYRRQSG